MVCSVVLADITCSVMPLIVFTSTSTLILSLTFMHSTAPLGEERSFTKIFWLIHVFLELPPDPTNPHGSRHCVIRGDPHIFQFDAGKFNPAQGIYVTGTCDYILVKTNCSTPYHNPEFIVTGAFRQDPLNPTHSSLHRVDASIIIDSKNWVRSNICIHKHFPLIPLPHCHFMTPGVDNSKGTWQHHSLQPDCLPNLSWECCTSGVNRRTSLQRKQYRNNDWELPGSRLEACSICCSWVLHASGSSSSCKMHTLHKPQNSDGSTYLRWPLLASLLLILANETVSLYLTAIINDLI